MSLNSGERLGRYEIINPIGAGGMGEVYRARDSELDRDVAIKVLPESVSQNPDRLARFEREAKAVAPFYSRSDDEGRKLIAAALSSSADIEVSESQLRVTLAPQSSPHRSRAIDALCASLNKHRTIVPGTNLQLVLACQQNPPSDVALTA